MNNRSSAGVLVSDASGSKAKRIAILCCPKCGLGGAGYLHQERVEVFHPIREDAKHGLHVTIVGQCLQMDRSMRGTPDHRNGLKVSYWCETCDGEDMIARRVLLLYQHEGRSCIEWEAESYL